MEDLGELQHPPCLQILPRLTSGLASKSAQTTAFEIGATVVPGTTGAMDSGGLVGFRLGGLVGTTTGPVGVMLDSFGVCVGGKVVVMIGGWVEVEGPEVGRREGDDVGRDVVDDTGESASPTSRSLYGQHHQQMEPTTSSPYLP